MASKVQPLRDPVPMQEKVETKIEQPNIFSRVAARVDCFFAKHFRSIGFFVATYPFWSILGTFVLVAACAAGFSQLESESGTKLWQPKGTIAYKVQEQWEANFRGENRFVELVIEPKSGDGVFSKNVLESALKLHQKLEQLEAGEDKVTLTGVCKKYPANSHPCMVESILEVWKYDLATLKADINPLATINGMVKSKTSLLRLLGSASFSGNSVQSAKVLRISYMTVFEEKTEQWEAEVLKLLKCDDPIDVNDDLRACGYSDQHITVYGEASRSWSDEFRSAIQADIALINAAFLVMALYMAFNLGNICHKIESRSLLALGGLVCIVMSGVAGFGLSMWFQFPYTPVHTVLPFVLLGIGVDDSFIIVNAFGRTSVSKTIPERTADTLEHAGISIMITSITDFVAFAISVSSILPALSSFCMYASLCIMLLFVFQITLFTPMLVLDERRVQDNRIDFFFCLPRGFACCPTIPKADAAKAIENGKPDPNALCCNNLQSKHHGGRIGYFLEHILAPRLVHPIASLAVIFTFVTLTSICAWQGSKLSVEDTQRKFIPDDSYVLSSIAQGDEHFGQLLGTPFFILLEDGDYFGSQAAILDIGNRLEKVDGVVPPSSGAFISWAVGFDAWTKLSPPTSSTEYYSKLSQYLSGAGKHFKTSVVFKVPADPQQGIRISRMRGELKSVLKDYGGRIIPDSEYAVELMDNLRAACNSWTDLPGGKAIPHNRQFTTYEIFKVIHEEIYKSVGFCFLAIGIVALVFIAHPLTAGLVCLIVAMTVVDLFGFMKMWRLAIDSVSVIQVVISIGLCVDYAVHVGHNFMLQTGTRSERVIATMGEIGSAVLCGGFSTFLGTMLLAFSGSYVFRVMFQTFFLTIVVGLVHGLILLPAILNLIGPSSYRTDVKTDPGTE